MDGVLVILGLLVVPALVGALVVVIAGGGAHRPAPARRHPASATRRCTPRSTISCR